MYTIYKHTLPNGKSYIGQTCLPLHRRFGVDFVNYNYNSYFYNAIEKYGAGTVKTEVLYSGLSVEEANRLETLCIFRFNTLKPYGYNLHTGGLNFVVSAETRQKISKTLTGHTVSEETRQKISKSKAGKLKGEDSPNFGKPLSDSHREAISRGLTGRKGHPHSSESRQKISDTLMGHPVSTESRKKMSESQTGKKHSLKTRQRMSEAHKNRLQDPKELEKRSGVNNWGYRRRRKAEWMWTRSLAMFWYECHDYITKRRAEFFDKEIPDTSSATQTLLF